MNLNLNIRASIKNKLYQANKVRVRITLHAEIVWPHRGLVGLGLELRCLPPTLSSNLLHRNLQFAYQYREFTCRFQATAEAALVLVTLPFRDGMIGMFST